jgi:hypothetical protein
MLEEIAAWRNPAEPAGRHDHEVQDNYAAVVDIDDESTLREQFHAMGR